MRWLHAKRPIIIAPTKNWHCRGWLSNKTRGVRETYIIWGNVTYALKIPSGVRAVHYSGGEIHDADGKSDGGPHCLSIFAMRDREYFKDSVLYSAEWTSRQRKAAVRCDGEPLYTRHTAAG